MLRKLGEFVRAEINLDQYSQMKNLLETARPLPLNHSGVTITVYVARQRRISKALLSPTVRDVLGNITGSVL
jgi:hypothetical protein